MSNSSFHVFYRCCGVVLFGTLWLLPARAEQVAAGIGSLTQAQGLPREFEAHFFDVPLAVRVDLDGRYLGEAMVVLGRDERVQMLEFTDTQSSQVPSAARRRWGEYLQAGRPLGDCQSECVDGLRAIHYSLVNSQLSLLTYKVEQGADVPRYHALPESGSAGLIVRNQLNLASNAGENSGAYQLQSQGSVGNWTVLADARADHESDSRQGTRHRMEQFYAERLNEQHFFRLGYFTPGAQGLTRQPRLLGASPDTTLGLMFGSSDSLLIDSGQASSTPIYVTPNRPGVAQIYRNGVLINSQPVQPGLQPLDTRVLPGGIYEVEVRLLEDNQETSRSSAFIYKPNNWQNPDAPWRYNLYLGRQAQLLSNWNDERNDSLSAGVLGNYLLHPRAVLGLSLQQVNEAMQYGSSLDWELLGRTRVYGNLYHTENQGNGYDLQLIHTHDLGSLVASYSQSWIETASASRRRPGVSQEQKQASLLVSQRVGQRSTATLRLSHSTGASQGLGLDVGWSFYGKVMGSDTNWRISLFDRPGTHSSGDSRSRGVNLSLSTSLGNPGKRIAASLGSRTSRDGGSDHNASLSYQQDVDLGAVRTLGATATVDRYGAGYGGDMQFQNPAMYGDAYVQSSSYNGELSAGLNLQSIVAMGGGKLALTGQYLPHDAGLIIDVDSDLPALELRADDSRGLSATLKPGRNVIPVGAYQAGHVQFDFNGEHDAAAVVQPTSLDYHLNRGGVEYRQLRVMRTVTVLGRLLDQHGQPLRGALVINHASRSVSEAGGHFAVEMSESTPTLEVRQRGQAMCLLKLDLANLQREDDLVLAGDLACLPEGLAQAGATHNGGKS
ncbi:CS1-pili formation C-terminal domain-containing protein [Pseudomonas putida]|uniref:CS1-pili formation C-terminal domain-containing protein n=1 Tax=Pseudomonas putida TaxID=303 RepID=UPI00300F276B